MSPQRGSDKHGPRLDDEMAHETEGLVRGNRATRAEEWRETEPVGGYPGPVPTDDAAGDEAEEAGPPR